MSIQRMARSRTAAASLALALALLTCGPAAGGTPEWVEIHPNEKAVEALPVGVPVMIYGKYVGLVEHELELWGVPLTFRLANPSLTRKLLEFQPNIDNVALVGSIQDEVASNGTRIFEVEQVLPAPGDTELFRRQLKAIFGKPDRESDELFSLAERLYRARELARTDELTALLERAVYEGYRLAARLLEPDDGDGHFELIRQIHERVSDRDLTVALLKRAAQQFPEQKGIARLLRQLGNRFVGGEWLEYSEFKRREGFVKHRNLWVKVADREFFEVMRTLSVENRTNLILRSKTDRAYDQLAEMGVIERGMNRREAARALGFPERVRRRQMQRLTVDQWDYRDQRVYFLNGQVYRIKEVGSSG